MRLITSTDIYGQMANWAVQQHPYHEPPELFEVLKFIREAAAEDFTDGVLDLPMGWFETENDLYWWLKNKLASHSIMKLWNTPRSGHTQPWVACSRYDGPSPEHDFIDIDALLMNVSRSVWRGAEEFSKAAA